MGLNVVFNKVISDNGGDDFSRFGINPYHRGETSASKVSGC